MLIGVVGKPSSGKSSFFKASTLIDVKIASYPFTTIESNHGIAYVTSPCPCKELDIKCNPQNSLCIDGIRLIPVELLDVAGLVPDSHLGKGKGNQFLNELIRGDILIHIVDASGKTDSEGNPCENHDPSKDIKFLEKEIDLWFTSVIKRNLEKIKTKPKEVLAGIGIKAEHLEQVDENLEPELLAEKLRKISKPIIIAANKIDIPSSQENLEKMKKSFFDLTIIPCSSESEITLKTAAKSEFINYIPGSDNFEILKELSEKQKQGLEFIKENVLKKYGSTGIQNCLNTAVFDFLKYIVVYPVENETKFSKKTGEILPDVFLMPPGSTAKDLAFKLHTDIGKNFLYAVDCRTKKRISSDHELKNRDVISIASTKK